MKKFVCTVCGYVYEGEAAPAECPVCHAPAEKFKEQTGEREWAAEHVVGVAQGVSEDILADLRANFEGECSEVGMYLAMARVAHREGYPEIGLYWEKAAYEEAEHAHDHHDGADDAEVEDAPFGHSEEGRPGPFRPVERIEGDLPDVVGAHAENGKYQPEEPQAPQDRVPDYLGTIDRPSFLLSHWLVPPSSWPPSPPVPC